MIHIRKIRYVGKNCENCGKIKGSRFFLITMESKSFFSKENTETTVARLCRDCMEELKEKMKNSMKKKK
jgi:hypothetical protein